MIPLAIIPKLPWRWIGIALAVVAVLAFAYNRGSHSRDAEVATLNQSIANLKAASAAAAAKNLAEVRAIETRDAQTQKEKDDAYQAHLGALNASYSQRLFDYAKAHPGVPGLDHVSETPDPAAGFDAASCREGFLCIPASTAFALMKAADKNTQQLVDLQDWVKATSEAAR